MGAQNKRKFLQVTGSCVVSHVVVSWGYRSSLGGITFRSCRLGSLVHSHLSVNLIEIKILHVHANQVLDEVALKELEFHKVPTEEHSIMLVSLLEGFNGLSSNGFNFLLSRQELLVFLHHQLALSLEVVPHNLEFLFHGVCLPHGDDQILLQF